jgi:hypothetical protein
VAEKRRMQAVKPSYADRRPLELTAEEAHEIWGHPSAKVISKLEQGVDGVKVKEGTVYICQFFATSKLRESTRAWLFLNDVIEIIPLFRLFCLLNCSHHCLLPCPLH